MKGGTAPNQGSRDADFGLAEGFGAQDILLKFWAPVFLGAGSVPGKDLKEGLLEGVVGESMRELGACWGQGTYRYSYLCTLTFLQLPAGPPAHGMLECTHVHAHHVSSTWTPAHACPCERSHRYLANTHSSLTPARCTARRLLICLLLHSLTPQKISREGVEREEASQGSLYYERVLKLAFEFPSGQDEKG